MLALAAVLALALARGRAETSRAAVAYERGELSLGAGDAHAAADAFAAARSAGLGLTVHAGEAEGPASIAAALAAGATRLGHGVRIFDDIERGPRGPLLGRIARQVLDEQDHLEVCISSNLDTGIYPDAASHPVMTLHRIGFSLSLSTDNRLMSGTTLEQEEQLCRKHLYASPGEIAALHDAGRRALFPSRRC